MTEIGCCSAARFSKKHAHELDEVFIRVHRSIRFPLRVWPPLVRNINARSASGSADAFATGSRPKELLRMASPRPDGHGILFHLALCPLCSERTRKHRSDAGHPGGISVRRTTFD